MSARKSKPTDGKSVVPDLPPIEGQGNSNLGPVKRIKKRTRPKIAPKFLLTVYKMIDVQ